MLTITWRFITFSNIFERSFLRYDCMVMWCLTNRSCRVSSSYFFLLFQSRVSYFPIFLKTLLLDTLYFWKVIWHLFICFFLNTFTKRTWSVQFLVITRPSQSPRMFVFSSLYLGWMWAAVNKIRADGSFHLYSLSIYEGNQDKLFARFFRMSWRFIRKQ